MMSLVRSAKAAFLLLTSLAAARSLDSQDTPNAKLSTRHGHGQCVSEAGQPDWYNRNLNTIRAIYDLTVFPNNIPILMAGGKAVPQGLFDANATGRVSPVGNFVNFEDSIEYFFALAPTPFTNNQSTAFYDSQVVDFVSACPEVAASLVYFRSGSVSMTGQLDESKPVSTLSQVAFWKFDEQGAVDKYQAWVPNLQAWTRASSGIDYSSMQVQAAAAQGLCPVIQQRCQGKDQQYASVEDCAQQLGAKPFGNFDEAWGDNIACRTIHIILTMVRPEVHCPHVGPTGGGKCVDVDYSTDYFDDEKLFEAPLGSVFTCSGPLQPDNQVGPGPGAAKILQGLAQAAAAGQLPGMPGMPGAGGAMGAAASAIPGMMGGAGAGATPSGTVGDQQGECPESGTPANPAAQSAADAMNGHEMSGGACPANGVGDAGTAANPAAQAEADAIAGKTPGGEMPGTAQYPAAQSAADATAGKTPGGEMPGTAQNPAAQSAADEMAGKTPGGEMPGTAQNPAAQSAADEMAGKTPGGAGHSDAGTAPPPQAFGAGATEGRYPSGLKGYGPPSYKKWRA